MSEEKHRSLIIGLATVDDVPYVTLSIDDVAIRVNHEQLDAVISTLKEAQAVLLQASEDAAFSGATKPGGTLH